MGPLLLFLTTSALSVALPEEGLLLELFANHAKPVATGEAPVDPASNPSKMTIGQESDAIEHPGYESFDGEIARFLIWARPLTDEELADTMAVLRSKYLKK
jgi:hypothetical protein